MSVLEHVLAVARDISPRPADRRRPARSGGSTSRVGAVTGGSVELVRKDVAPAAGRRRRLRRCRARRGFRERHHAAAANMPNPVVNNMLRRSISTYHPSLKPRDVRLGTIPLGQLSQTWLYNHAPRWAASCTRGPQNTRTQSTSISCGYEPWGVAAAGTAHCQIQPRKRRCSRRLERPYADRLVEVSMPVAGTLKYGCMRRPRSPPRSRCRSGVPRHAPGVPPAVHGDRMRLECRAGRVGVHRGTGRPVPVAVPLHQVDLAAAAGVVVGQPPGRPATTGEAVEFDAGFPGGPDRAPPRATHQAAEVTVGVAGRAQHEIGFAVHEHVLAAVGTARNTAAGQNPRGY